MNELLKRRDEAQNHFDNADAEHITAACYELCAADAALQAYFNQNKKS